MWTGGHPDHDRGMPAQSQPQSSSEQGGDRADLKDYLGIRQVIWLGQGYEQDETDGHIDEIACFARPGVVLALTTDDTGDTNFRIFQDNLDRLKAARDANGREIEVVTLRQPERRNHNGVRLTLSYTNF